MAFADPKMQLNHELSCWDVPCDKEARVTDPFTLMDRLVACSTNKGQYFANPMLLHRFAYHQDDWDAEAVAGWLLDLEAWGEVTIEPLAVNCYSGESVDVVTIVNRRRFRRFADRPFISKKVRTAVYERDDYRCVACGSTGNLSVDHIVPWSRGGEHTMDNFQTLCLPCNIRKGASTDALVQG